MNRIYHPYWKWEDYLNGMWRKESREYEERMLPLCIEFTGDHLKYGKAMMEVVNAWPVTCEHNLSDLGQNRKAFIGHCAVCYKLGIPEYITRIAWGYLNLVQQTKANAAAERAIKSWESGRTTYKALSIF